MRDIRPRNTAALLCVLCGTAAYAQQPTTAVPKLVRLSGSFRPANGVPAQPVESVTLSVYRDQVGGNALWQETQNVSVDGEGKYSLLMGATQNEGMPMELLSSGEPRWVGAQFNRPGEAEQPRSLLASVPYALKSVDAETLGGRPASAYLLAEAPASLGATASTGALATTSVLATTNATTLATSTTAVKPHAITGTMNFIPVFTDTTNDLGNSAMYQLNGNIGIGTVPGANAPTAPSLDLRTSPFSQIGMAQTTDYLTFFAADCCGPAIYWDPARDLRFGPGGAALYNPFGFVEQMRIQSSTGNVGIGTQTPGSKLDVVGNINFSGSVLWQGSAVLQLPGGSSGNNVALGLGAMASNTPGFYNTASGFFALRSNNTGTGNTATGYQALWSNTTASGNTANGFNALGANTTGGGNTAIGSAALGTTTTGSDNTASGAGALASNTIANGNTATGWGALGNNTTGNANTADGTSALQSNTTGNYNTAIGSAALEINTTGSNNIAIGLSAAALVSDGNSNNIHIGTQGASGDSAVIRIGGNTAFGDLMTQTAFYASGIGNANVSGVPVLINTSTGQLGVASSSRRFKEDIEDMGEASRDLMRLRPVTFRYKNPFADGSKPIQYGLIAEEVDEVYPNLVAHSADGQIETVKYQVLDSMLLNEVQKQYQHTRQQDETIRKQQEQVLQQQEQIRKLEGRLAALEGLLSGKVSATATAER